jgi:hypothetical protein
VLVARLLVGVIAFGAGTSTRARGDTGVIGTASTARQTKNTSRPACASEHVAELAPTVEKMTRP